MAKFNDKVLCLFNKDHKQLHKEAERRGMRHDGREKTIAQIIWKDAYDAGFTEGKNFATAIGNAVRNCPANCCGNVPQAIKAYCLHDIGNNVKYRLELTSEQVRMFEWLQEMEYLSEMELTEWSETFEDIGRI